MKVWAIDLTHHDDESRGFLKPRKFVTRSDYKKAIDALIRRLKKKYAFRMLYTISLQSISHGTLSPTHCHMLVQCDDDSIVDAILDYWTKEKQYGGLANRYQKLEKVRSGQHAQECYDAGKWWYIRFQDSLGLHLVQHKMQRISKSAFRDMIEEEYPVSEEDKADFMRKFDKWRRNSDKSFKMLEEATSYEATAKALCEIVKALEESVTEMEKQGKDLTEWESCLSLVNAKVHAILNDKV